MNDYNDYFNTPEMREVREQIIREQAAAEDYANEHPELVAAFMQTAAQYVATTMIAQQIRAGFDDLADAIKDAST